MLYQWIEEVREFLNQEASERNVDALGKVNYLIPPPIPFCTHLLTESFVLDGDESESTSLDKDEDLSEASQHDPDELKERAMSVVCPPIHHGDPLTDRKSTFQAHAAEVNTTDEVSIYVYLLTTVLSLSLSLSLLFTILVITYYGSVSGQDCSCRIEDQ